MGELTGLGICKMHIIDETGDTKHMWNPRDMDEVAAARKLFQTFNDKGFKAFRVNARGEAGERIREFDPSAEKIIFIPQLAGGM